MRLRKIVDSPAWFVTFLLATLATIFIYAANLITSEANPGNYWGVIYGTSATILMVGAALYGVRRRMVNTALKYRLGKSRTWVQYHIYGGTLFLLLMFMHSGFSLPNGSLNWLLWSLSIWVTLSGLFGVFLQKWIPKILSSGLSTEILYQRIPTLTTELKIMADDLVKNCTLAIRDFYRKNIAEMLLVPNTRFIYYLDITGGIQKQMRKFDYFKNVLSVEDQDDLEKLELMYKTKLELDAHYTLQKALKWWLYSHVPLSLVLVALVALHLFVVFYY